MGFPPFFNHTINDKLKNDGNPIPLQERACKETTYPKKRQICEPIVLDKTSNNIATTKKKVERAVVGEVTRLWIALDVGF